MSVNLAHKKEKVADLSAMLGESQSVVAAHYSGLTVAQMTELRSLGRERGVRFKIVKNTLARRALVGSQFSGLSERLVGPVILAMSIQEPNAAAKLVQEFSSEHKSLQVQVIGLDNSVLEASALAKIAKMPNREQAIVLLLGVLQAPARNLACTLQETYAKLVRTVQAVAKHKESQ